MGGRYLGVRAHNQIIMRRQKNHTHKSVDMRHRLWYNCPRQNYGAAILDRRKAGHEVLLPLFYFKHWVGMSNLLALMRTDLYPAYSGRLRCLKAAPEGAKGGVWKTPAAEAAIRKGWVYWFLSTVVVSSSATRRLYPWSQSDFRCDHLRPWYLLPVDFTEVSTT